MSETKLQDHAPTTLDEPILVGSTGIYYHGSVQDTFRKDSSGSKSASPRGSTSTESNHFRSAEWTADGTTVLTVSADNVLRTFILPPDILSSHLHTLSPYSSSHLPSPPYALATYPAYSLSSPSTALYLVSLSSLPIRLISPFAPGILASYSFINPATEAYIAPHSLHFDDDGCNRNHFFAGGDCEIAVFDINRNGDGPFCRMKSIPSRRKKIVGGGVGMKGIISTLAMSSEGLLAAGTFNRWVGLYDSRGRGGSVGVFGIQDNQETEESNSTYGAGITQVLWSPCGQYLCVVERGSDGIGVWDIRGSGKRLSWLKGRRARTMQRLGAEIVDRQLWAGGTDGVVRFWKNVGTREGMIDPEWEFMAHDDAVSSATMHPSAAVLATCSGQRHAFDASDTYNDSSDNSNGSDDNIDNPTALQSYDNSLKIWAL